MFTRILLFHPRIKAAVIQPAVNFSRKDLILPVTDGKFFNQVCVCLIARLELPLKNTIFYAAMPHDGRISLKFIAGRNFLDENGYFKHLSKHKIKRNLLDGDLLFLQ